MKAYKYKVKTSIDAVHSWGDQIIDEIWVPDLKIVVNEKGFVFHSDTPREEKDNVEIEIDDSTVSILETHMSSLERLNTVINHLF